MNKITPTTRARAIGRNHSAPDGTFEVRAGLPLDYALNEAGLLLHLVSQQMTDHIRDERSATSDQLAVMHVLLDQAQALVQASIAGHMYATQENAA